MNVSNVMQRKVITVRPGTTLAEAGRLIFGNRIGSLPVVDDRGKLVGLVVEKDILEKLYPSHKDLVNDFFSAGDFGRMEKEAGEILELPVSEVMTEDVLTTYGEVSLMRATSTMLLRRVSVLPVIDEKGILVGILSSNDVFGSVIGKRVPFWKVEGGLYDSIAKQYDILMDWRRRFSQEIPFLVKFFGKLKAKRLIDIGCGTGEHVLMMGKKGFGVVGVDKSKRMLLMAREKLEAVEDKVKKRVKFRLVKISDFNNLISDKFDGGYCLGNVIADTDDLKNELENIYYVLKKGGRVVFQVENFAKLIKTGDCDLRFDIKKVDDKKIDKYGFLRFYEFREDGFLDFNVITLVKYKNENWKSWGVDKASFWPVDKAKFGKLLKEVGFLKVRFYGDFERASYIEDKSEYLIVTAEK